MNTLNPRRGLGPIRDQHDCRQALDEMGTLLSQGDALCREDRIYLDELGDVVRRYTFHCPENSLKADPHRMLIYQLESKQVDEATAARDTGIADLHKLVDGLRRINDGDAVRLAAYFGCSVEGFKYGPIIMPHAG